MQQDKVSFKVEGNQIAKPVVATTNLDGAILSTRSFEVHDFERVLDFGQIIPASPADQTLRHQSGIQDDGKPFKEHWFCLRGCFLFYFDPRAVVSGEGEAKHYRELPLGVIPLERTEIEFPPGGRRVFQQHAQTAGTRGYEFVIRHVPKAGTPDAEKGQRREEYIVADTLTQREEWRAVLSSRSGGLKRDTTLRPGVTPPPNLNTSVTEAALSVAADIAAEEARNLKQTSRPEIKKTQPSIRKVDFDLDDVGESTKGGDYAQYDSSRNGMTFAINSLAQYAANDNDEAGDIMDNELLKQFTRHRFHDEEWVEQYFATHSDVEAEAMCREIEQTQLSVKRGLRGAVLEQYKYFVEASCEMTVMGSEVVRLRSLVDNQAGIINKMKDMNFIEAFTESDPLLDDDDMYYEDEDDEDDADDDSDEEEDEGGEAIIDEDEVSAASSQSSTSQSKRLSSPRKESATKLKKFPTENGHLVTNTNGSAGRVHIPEWLGDVTEEISAFLKECRFTEATDLTLKARNELSELLQQHERWPGRQLRKRQQTSVRRILMEIEKLTTLLGDRITETLRRKNEALKQTFKRERQDPMYELTPLLSPVCLDDDLSALQLLVKLGRPNDAAIAYSNRRSIQLSESLNERKIANSGSIMTDVVIFASQLSQGFFSCLAVAIEGFMDLFLTSDFTASTNGNGDVDDLSLSNIATKKVPAKAMASIVLWCDQELAKFAATFGGSRVLGRLALSPAPTTGSSASVCTIRTEDSQVTSFTALSAKAKISVDELRKRLKVAEDKGDYQVAGSLRRRLNRAEVEERKQREDEMRQGASQRDLIAVNERQVAVEVAAKCVEHAFLSASRNLDAIGLPVVPRLAECLKPRLKGCEPEIAEILKAKWGHILSDWIQRADTDTSGDANRRSRRSRREGSAPNLQ